MRNLILVLLFACFFVSCQRFYSDYQSRLKGIQAVCPKCTYVRSEGYDYAQDTSKNPNIVYKVYWCGGFYYSVSTVEHLVRIN